MRRAWRQTVFAPDAREPRTLLTLLEGARGALSSRRELCDLRDLGVERVSNSRGPSGRQAPLGMTRGAGENGLQHAIGPARTPAARYFSFPSRRPIHRWGYSGCAVFNKSDGRGAREFT